jgi:hypothetical protein
MLSLMTRRRIDQENQKFRDTGGVSRNNRGAGFHPAFCDMSTGRTELSRLAGGVPAPIHVLCGVPEEWVVARDAAGAVSAVKTSVVAGFLRDGRFYTREEAARAVAPHGGVGAPFPVTRTPPATATKRGNHHSPGHWVSPSGDNEYGFPALDAGSVATS